MGYGTGPFGSALGIYPPPPGPETPSDLSSSRKIDGVKKRYVLDAIGGFLPMDDTDQRVLLTLAFAETEMPFITPQAMRQQELKIRAALAANGLVDVRAPVIELELVSVERTGPGETTATVKYRNLISGTTKTVKR